MQDDSSQGASTPPLTELIRIITRFVDKRGQFRRDYFASNVEPLLAEMRESHSDFTNICARIEKASCDVLAAVYSRSNSTLTEIDAIQTDVDTTSANRESGRMRRRELFGRATALQISIEEALVSNRVYFSTNEIQRINSFADQIVSYFSNEDREYSHKAGKFIEQLLAILEEIAENGRTPEALDSLENLISDVRSYRNSQEKKWIETCTLFYQLNLSLR